MNVIIDKNLDNLLVICKHFMILAILICLLNACSINSYETKPIISVSILPQKYFLEKIAGDHFEINVLIPPGASPATYDPSPAQIVELSKSQIYFKIGHIEFEKNWLDKISLEYPQLNIIDNSSNLDLMETQHFVRNHGHHHGSIEPHTWMSPKNAKVIASSMFEAILSLDNINESFYTKNFNQLISEIDSLNKEISILLQDIKARSFIIYHPALTYFAETYRLKQIPIEIEGKNPSAFHIKQIIDTAKSQNIKIVFIQKQFDQDKAKTIANEIDGYLIPIDPLDYNWQSQLLTIANSFVKVPDTKVNE